MAPALNWATIMKPMNNRISSDAARPDAGIVEPGSQQVGHGDGVRFAGELRQPLAENREPGERHDHVTADPQRDDPAVRCRPATESP